MSTTELSAKLMTASPAEYLALLSKHAWKNVVFPRNASTESKKLDESFVHEFSRNVSKDMRSEILSIPVGSLPLRNFNARTIKVPKGGNVIVFDTELQYWLFSVIVIWSGLASWGSDKSPADYVPAKYSLREAARLANLFTWSRLSSELPPFQIDASDIAKNVNQKTIVVSSIVSGMEYFILAHEYAHVLLRHNGEETTVVHHLRSEDDDEVDLSVLKRSRAQEFAADELGHIILTKSWSGKSGIEQIQKCGSFIFMICLDFFDKIVNFEFAPFSSSVREELLTHPKAMSRFDALYATFANEMKMDQHNFIMAVKEEFNSLSQQFQVIYETAMEVLSRNPEEFQNNIKSGMRTVQERYYGE